MPSIYAVTLTENVNHWLLNSGQPRILHIFGRACNLINEHREVLSVVTAEIGNGPLNLVVEELMFLEYLDVESRVFIDKKSLNLGDFTIDTAIAETWDPCPRWERMHEQQNHILQQLKQLQIMDYEFNSAFSSSSSIIANFTHSVATADLPTATKLARQLAGLGMGLTPSGDDFLIGATYAALILQPHEIAVVLAHEIAIAAAPLTTSLSTAWLLSAARGEAGILWHEFFDALLSAESLRIQVALDKLLAVGESSGADAMAGFVKTFQAIMPGK